MAILYGTKVGMTRVYDGDVAIPVTVIECKPNQIVQVKTQANDGVDSLKVAVGAKTRVTTKPVGGEYKKAEVAPRRFMREIRVTEAGAVEAKPGVEITVGVLDQKKLVNVFGQTKGRGFTGVMKRWNFKGHKMTHGTMGHRGPGSIGCRMDPGKVFKGKKMAGVYGNEQVTIKNLKIVSIDAEKNLVVIKGAIPGPNGGLVAITQN